MSDLVKFILNKTGHESILHVQADELIDIIEELRNKDLEKNGWKYDFEEMGLLTIIEPENNLNLCSLDTVKIRLEDELGRRGIYPFTCDDEKYSRIILDLFIDLTQIGYKSKYLERMLKFVHGPIALYLPMEDYLLHDCYKTMLKRGLITGDIKPFDTKFENDQLVKDYENYLRDIIPFTLEIEPIEGNLSDYKTKIVFDELHQSMINVLNDGDFLNYISINLKMIADKDDLRI